MSPRRRALLLGGSLVLASCSTAAGAGGRAAEAPAFEPTADPTIPAESDESGSSEEPADAGDTTAEPTVAAQAESSATDSAPADSAADADSGTTAAPSTAEPSTTARRTTTTSTTTTTEPPLDVHDPDCVVVIEAGDSLSLIAGSIDDELVTVSNLQGENGLSDVDVIQAGDYLDVCVDNGIDDITGEKRVNTALVAAAQEKKVERQQRNLNRLFTPLGSPELLVDGISGPLTRQMLCAARLALGLPTSLADMQPGSKEEKQLLSAKRVSVPWNEGVQADRWAIVDRTCQVMFVGQGTEEVSFVFPVSTGEEGHETDLQTRAPSFRYDPALDNDGWHNSTLYPVPADDPLNGNMYRPVYFNNGEAIHGANFVPPYPRSKGCVRLSVAHQDALIGWLGLDGADGPVWDSGGINLAVTVQGDYAA